MSRSLKAKIALLLAAVLLVCAAALSLAYFWMYSNANLDPSPNSEASEESSNNPFPVVDWDYWRSINSDIIGWVTVPGTEINQPIMQGPKNDPDFYLRHDIYKNWSLYGTPYLDADNADTGLLFSKNAVVYGHHMNEGEMFTPFWHYQEKDFAQDHQTILVQTPEYQVVYYARYANVIDGTTLSRRSVFLDDTDYKKWYTDNMATAKMVLDDTTMPDSVITFCTCSYTTFNNERTLVITSPEKLYVGDTAIEITGHESMYRNLDDQYQHSNIEE